MNDAEMAEILPRWKTMNRKKRDKMFKEYTSMSIGQEHTPEFQLIEARCEAFERERLLKKLPRALEERNTMSLILLVEDWEHRFQGSTPDIPLALEAWDRAASAILESFDTRDGMFAVPLHQIIRPILVYCGRAASKMQKSAKFAAFMTFCIAGGNDTPISAVPMRHHTIKTLTYVLSNIPDGFLNRLGAAGTVEALVTCLDGCCPSLLAMNSNALQLILFAAKDKNKQDLIPQFRRAAEIANKRILETNMNAQHYPGLYGVAEQRGQQVDIGEIVGALATLVQMLAICVGIQTPLAVRKHLKPFGDKYRPVEPRDPLERSRWSNRYAAMRVAEADWTVEPPDDMIQGMTMAGIMMESERQGNAQCAACHKKENPESKIRLSKCSRCRLVLYCNRECQLAHWRAHKSACRKKSRSSVPERLLTLGESLSQMHAIGTAGGSTVYPVLFAVWVDWKYNETSAVAS